MSIPAALEAVVFDVPLKDYTYYLSVVKCALDRGFDVNTQRAAVSGRDPIWGGNGCYNGPIWGRGADSNEVALYGEPAVPDGEPRALLHVACRRLAVRVVRFLLSHGADVNARTPTTGQTPLIVVMESITTSKDDILRAIDILGLLADAGADFSHRDARGNTPLHRWAGNRCVTGTENQEWRLAASVCRFVGFGGFSLADVNSKGNTPLAVAATTSPTTLCELLRSNWSVDSPSLHPPQAVLDMQNSDGDTCMHLLLREMCCTYCDKPPDRVTYLVRDGRRVQVPPIVCPVPNVRATHLQNAVRTLVRYGASLKIKGRFNDTAVEILEAPVQIVRCMSCSGRGRRVPVFAIDASNGTNTDLNADGPIHHAFGCFCPDDRTLCRPRDA